MLLGSASQKPNIARVREIKRILHAVLGLPDEATVTLSQLACLEKDCAPLETVIGLLQPGLPQKQHKIHKATNDLVATDLVEICEAWERPVKLEDLQPFFKEN